MAPAIVRASSLMKLAPGFEELESGIVVPQSSGLLTIEMITREALRVFMKQNTFASSVMKSSAWAEPVGKHMTIRIRKTG